MNRAVDNTVILIATIVILGGCSRDGERPFVPDSFHVPQGMQAERFRLRKLTSADAAADYEAVMESKIRLRRTFGDEWPSDEFTIQENQAELAEHERAFADRLAFTYTVVSLDDSRVLGCVYIFPDQEADAQVLFWLRDSAVSAGLQPALESALESWLGDAWPFAHVNYVGVE